MEQRLSCLTFGVRDIAKSKTFYQAMGFKTAFEHDDVAFIQMNGFVLSLYSKKSLARDMKRKPAQLGVGLVNPGFNTRTKKEVDVVYAKALKAGAKGLHKPHEMLWGGYSCYFTDPDGIPWEIAWNPSWPISRKGETKFKK